MHRFRNTNFAQSNKYIDMSFLNAIINGIKEGELREELQDRLDIIQHKIKFMDAVPLVCLDTHNQLNYALEGVALDAGGIFHPFADGARVVIYLQKDKTIAELMAAVPALLEPEWPAVTYNRVYLMDGAALADEDPLTLVTALEDLAEMLYPGYFVFGNEGINWISFKTQ